MNVSRFLYEFLTSFIVGGVPFLFAYREGGVHEATTFMQSIDTKASTVKYFCALAILHIILSIAGKYAPRHFSSVKSLFHLGVYPILNRIGDTLLCFYRVISGVMIGCAIIGVTYYPLAGYIGTSLVYVALTFPFIWASAAIGTIYDYGVSKQV